MKIIIILLCLAAMVGCTSTHTDADINKFCAGPMETITKGLGEPIAKEYHYMVATGGTMYWSYLLVPKSLNYTDIRFHIDTKNRCYVE